MTETGGYCLPDFIKKGIPLFFAVDNIDCLEDTPYGQGTLHGTVIVVCQKEDENAELINPPLAIPDKLPSSPLHVDIKSKDDPLIQLKPIKFTSYTIGQRANLLKQYYLYDETWGLANHMANNNDCVTQSSSFSLDTYAEINLEDDFALRSTDASSSAIHENDHPIAMREGNTTTLLENGFAPRTLDIATTTISENELAPTTSDVAMSSIHEDDNADTTYEETILNVAPKKIRKEKQQKSEVMPTWGATNSLLQPIQNVDSTNSEVVALLFKTSPTDYATLYTVLSLTQEISAIAMGPEQSTIVTLDLVLYERTIKIQESVSCSRWVLRAGELHICFAVLHALGKYSGLDTIAIETGIYSPASLRGIYAGKAFKRGVEYHAMNVLACLFPPV